MFGITIVAKPHIEACYRSLMSIMPALSPLNSAIAKIHYIRG
jgi:hypothetical protein